MDQKSSYVDIHSIEVVSFDVAYTLLSLDVQKIAALAKIHLGLELTVAQIMCVDRQLRCEYLTNATRSHAIQHHCITEIIFEIIKRLAPDGFAKTHPDLWKRFQDACRSHQLETNFFSRVHADGLSALDFLKEYTDLQIIVISNAPATLERDLNTVGLLPYFDHVLGSTVECVGKPDAEIFTRAADRCGVKIEAILHIDDNPFVGVEAAIRAGAQGVLYDPEYCCADLPIPAPRINNHMDLAQHLLIANH